MACSGNRALQDEKPQQPLVLSHVQSSILSVYDNHPYPNDGAARDRLSRVIANPTTLNPIYPFAV